MKATHVLLVFFLLIAGNSYGGGYQSAREYYDELYKAGGLDGFADEFVCFDDDPALQNFFIIGRSETIKAFLEENHRISKLPKKAQAELAKGFLYVKSYAKGVPVGTDEDTYVKDGSTWVTDTGMIQNVPVRIRLSISWQTLRYKKAVEMLNPNRTLKQEFPRYGKCEAIPPDVQQKGHLDN